MHERVSGVSQVDLDLCIFLLALEYVHLRTSVFGLRLTPTHSIGDKTIIQTLSITALVFPHLIF